MLKKVKGQLKTNTNNTLTLCGYELKSKSKIKLQLNDKWVTVTIGYGLGSKTMPGKAYAHNLDGLTLDGRMAKAYIKI